MSKLDKHEMNRFTVGQKHKGLITTSKEQLQMDLHQTGRRAQEQVKRCLFWVLGSVTFLDTGLKSFLATFADDENLEGAANPLVTNCKEISEHEKTVVETATWHLAKAKAGCCAQQWKPRCTRAERKITGEDVALQRSDGIL